MQGVAAIGGNSYQAALQDNIFIERIKGKNDQIFE